MTVRIADPELITKCADMLAAPGTEPDGQPSGSSGCSRGKGFHV